MNSIEDEKNYSHYRIILVEDNEDDEYLTVRTLLKCGLSNVTVEKDASAALEKLAGLNFEETPPDILITDIHLPGISGIEFLHTLKRNVLTKDIPAVVLTSSIDPHEKEECLSLGALDFIQKPPTTETITTLISRIKR